MSKKTIAFGFALDDVSGVFDAGEVDGKGIKIHRLAHVQRSDFVIGRPRGRER